MGNINNDNFLELLLFRFKVMDIFFYYLYFIYREVIRKIKWFVEGYLKVLGVLFRIRILLEGFDI